MTDRFLLSWDTVISVVITLVTLNLIPNTIDLGFVSTVYEIGISVLSIVFSIFFASLAIITSLSDSEFVEFLEKEGDYSLLLKTFKVTLFMLFGALCYSIVMYVVTRYHVSNGGIAQSKYYFLIFELLFCYSMIATLLSVKNTLLFSKYRIMFLESKKK